MALLRGRKGGRLTIARHDGPPALCKAGQGKAWGLIGANGLCPAAKGLRQGDITQPRAAFPGSAVPLRLDGAKNGPGMKIMAARSTPSLRAIPC